MKRLNEAGVLSALDRQFALSVARLTGVDPDGPACLGFAAASRAAQQGHVCADLARLADQLIRTPDGEGLAGAKWPSLAGWREALLACPAVMSVGASGGVRPLVLDGSDRLYLARSFAYQQRLAEFLLKRAAAVVRDLDPKLLDAGLARLFDSSGPDASNPQAAGARVACERLLSVISGGPGTGKTSTVVRILALLVEQNLAVGADPPRVALLAPTGKAAARLSESVQQALAADGDRRLQCPAGVRKTIPHQASTIHRALGRNPRRPARFVHHAGRPLAVDVVVVDEASMVDLALMAKLVEALPAQARLILLGDRDQLVSVEAGAVLGDICPPSEARQTGTPLAACVVELTHSYRFAADTGIGALSRAINGGDSDQVMDLLTDAGQDQVQWLTLEDPSHARRVLGTLIQDGFRPTLAGETATDRLAAFGAFRILCAHRSGALGLEAFNPLVEQLLRVDGLRPDGAFYEGRPIMVTHNDYQVGLFNGDTGLMAVDPDSRQLRAYFPGRDRPLPPAQLPVHETAFAMTAHKSQGSEFDEVLVVLPPQPSAVLTRELLYTAVTRARKRVTVCGSETVIRHAVETPVQRFSGLRELLWGEGR